MTRIVTGLGAALGALLASGVATAADGGADPWQFGFQEAVTPVAQQIHDFHDLLLVIIVLITLFVLGLLLYVMVRFRESANPNPSKTTHNTLVEIVWTVVPVLILVVIAIPSFKLLYFMDRAEDPDMTLKVTANQWYWEYEYPDYTADGDPIGFAAFLKPDQEIGPGEVRLLETDNRVVVPVDTTVRVLITSNDVIHSWAMPAFGIKTDAVPGRLNETWFKAEKEGVYYGMCSELCGKDHGFMPIAVEVVSKQAFETWTGEELAAMRGDDAVSVAANDKND